MKMNINLKLNILGVLVIFQCYVAISGDVIYDDPPKYAGGTRATQNASYMVQQVTNSIDYVGQIIYFRTEDEIIYPNRIKNGTANVWHVNTGKKDIYYLEELSKEVIAIISPIKQNVDQYLVGSDRNLRLFTRTSTGFNGSDPLIHFNNKGFIIYLAHCDRNGIMFILLVGNNNFNSHLGTLYKIEDKKAVFVMDFNNNPGGFGFNGLFTAMYMINDQGKKITKFNYDLNTKELGAATEVFDMDIYPELKYHIMTSVVVDKNNEHLWVTAAGKEGYVIEIDPVNKSVVTVTSLPSNYLTSITFGNRQSNVLYVGSKRTCMLKGKAQGAIYAISGTGAEGSLDTPIAW